MNKTKYNILSSKINAIHLLQQNKHKICMMDLAKNNNGVELHIKTL